MLNPETVTAIISPPGESENFSVNLEDSDEDGTYEGVYENFTKDGIYNITIYAGDTEGTYTRLQDTVTLKTGDINGDTELNMADAVLAMKALAGMDISGKIRQNYVASCVDVNKDQHVGLEEVIYILKNLTKPE